MPNKAKNMYTDAILNVIDEYKLIVDKYKGKEMGFDNYIDEIEERVTRHSEGKS